MHEENFAPNYNIFTGKAKETTPTLGEILTGSLWALARQRYCGDDPDAFPLALVGVYDKTNRDVFFHFHVHHSFVHHHSWTKTVSMMTPITWYWVISQILDMEKEKQKNWQLRWNYRINTLSVLSYQSNYWNSWRRRFLDWSDGTVCAYCCRPIGPTYVVGPWTHEYRKKKQRRFLITEK